MKKTTTEKKQTYFITGGSGFLGINLVRFLLARHQRVISYDLVEFSYPDCRDQITAVVGDIRDKTKLRQAMRGADVVIHCAAALPLYSPADIFSTDVQGTKNVLTIAQDLGIDRVVHISSTAVYGVPDHHPLFETDELIGVGPYGQAKIQAENVCLDFRRQGMCVPILRPKSFVGPERLGVFALLYDWAKDGCSFPVIGSGHNLYQLLDVEDLCQVIFTCATGSKKQVNDTFNIGAAQFDTMKNDYQVVLDKAGFGKRIISTPAGLIIFCLKILEKLKLSPLYAWVYETAGKDSFVSIEKAQKKLGFTPKYSNAQALLRNYEWYLAHQSDFAGQSGVSHRVPWGQGVLGLAKMVFRLI